MVTELLPLKLDFRRLSDEDVDPAEADIDTADEDLDEDDDDDDLTDNSDGDDATVDPVE